MTIAKTPTRNEPRTAVLVVHGMGNQRPLVTVKAIARAIYFHVPVVGQDKPRRWWTKVDRQAGDIDLPVITTAAIRSGGKDRIVDFHECYWAPLTAESQFVAVPLWLFELVKKGPTTMLPDRRLLWFLIAALLCFWIVSLSLLGLTAIVEIVGRNPPSWLAALLPWLAAVLICLACMGWRGLAVLGALLTPLVAGWLALRQWSGWDPDFPLALGSSGNLLWAIVALVIFFAVNWLFLLTVVGDAARYLRGAPENIAVRRAVRAQGVNVLQRLHNARWDTGPKYDRIIIVAHSLGSVVAYDMLRAYWAHVASSLGNPLILPDGPAQNDRDDRNASLPSPQGRWSEIDAWRSAARRLLTQLDSSMLDDDMVFEGDFAKRWIVSDFVTLASPLSQAELLLTEDSRGRAALESLYHKRKERDFPISPALKAESDGVSDGTLAYIPDNGTPMFHHGALFGLTRWTNLYFPLRGFLWGDIIGGPVAPNFGRGVKDVPISGAGRTSWACHTYYWTSPGDNVAVPVYLDALRKAVDLWE